MTNQILNLGTLAIVIHTFILTAFIFLFYSYSYSKKYESKPPYIIGYIICAVIYSIVSVIGITAFNIMSTIAIINIPAFMLYNFKIKTGIFYNLLCFLCIACADLFVGLTASAFLDKALYHFINGDNFYIIYNTINLLITFILINILIKFTSRKDRKYVIKTSDLIVLIILTVFEFITLFFIITRSTKVSDVKILIFVLIGFFVTNVVFSFQFSRISRLNYEKSKAQLIETQNLIQLSHIKDTIIKYEESRKIIHDMRKHLAVIENLKGYEPKVLQDYVKNFNNSIKNLAGEFVCTNRILSVIMDMKINQAQRSGIDVQMNFEDVPFDFISDIDVTAIFSNLWDNAIEGTLSVEGAKRYINITIGYEGPIILVVFENNFNHQISEENGKHFTSKGGNHEGLGLQIIKRAVENYNGHLLINHKDSVFNVTISFNK